MVHKVYLDVICKYDTYGNIKPLSLTWEDGTTYRIDRVLECHKATSLKVGGVGLRFTCSILNNQTYIFKEDNRWFVDDKDVPLSKMVCVTTENVKLERNKCECVFCHLEI